MIDCGHPNRFICAIFNEYSRPNYDPSDVFAVKMTLLFKQGCLNLPKIGNVWTVLGKRDGSFFFMYLSLSRFQRNKGFIWNRHDFNNCYATKINCKTEKKWKGNKNNNTNTLMGQWRQDIMNYDRVTNLPKYHLTPTQLKCIT